MRHPLGLYLLFATEAWERFSFYGMRALLVLYLTKHLHYDRAEALHLYAAYTALAYFSPLFGGYLSDRYLGSRRAVLCGGVMMSLGHFTMAFESAIFLALGLLVLGNGFFKPNISALVGGLYTERESLRDEGYTIFYMGINLGAFLAPLVCGTLGERYGWHYGFGAAGVGMLVSLALFARYSNKLLPASASRLSAERTAQAPLTKVEKQRVFVIIVMTLFATLFWMGFEQAGGTMTLFADTQTRLDVGAFTIPTSWFQTLNPLCILLFAPLVARGWGKSAVHPLTRQGVGLLLLGLGFAVMFAAEGASIHGRLVSPLWLVAVYLIHTLGELCVSPVGLTLVSRLAPTKVASLMMAVWFLSSFLANYLGGTLEAVIAYFAIQLSLWEVLMATSFIGGLCLLLASRPLQRLT